MWANNGRKQSQQWRTKGMSSVLSGNWKLQNSLKVNALNSFQ